MSDRQMTPMHQIHDCPEEVDCLIRHGHPGIAQEMARRLREDEVRD